MKLFKRKKKIPADLVVFGILEEYQKKGLIHLDLMKRQVMIEYNLSMVMMTNADNWHRFMIALFRWTYVKQYCQNYDACLMSESNKAISRAKEKFPSLTIADVQRIREAKNRDIVIDDIVPPKIEPIEFYVIRLDSTTLDEEKVKPDAIPAGRVMIVGRYDGDTDTTDMATWDEVQNFLNKNKKESNGK